jgi:alkylation response protein AidB-like acyl-CoA dehydrogenase
MLASSTHGALGSLLAGHQSVGLPRAVLSHGTPEQQRGFLPRCVREISAFLPAEPDDDPSQLPVTAARDGESYVLNGVRTWNTNGVVADLLVVMAVAPGGMSAFVVPGDTQGLTVEHRNAFLGLRGGENGVIRLHDVTVPAWHRIGAEGEGLQLAAAAHDLGTLAIPAVCAANAKWSLKIAREWSRVRVRWGKPIGEHEAVASRIAFMAATAFALEALVEVTARHTDAGVDTSIEAELAKKFAADKAWRIADDLVQIRGIRGYETAESASARGERGVPVEQHLRDLRIGRVFDGASASACDFLAAAISDAPLQGRPPRPSELAKAYGPLGQHVRFADRTARKLARHIDCGKARWGKRLATRHMFLARVVDIAAELYAMTASCVYAKEIEAFTLADAFCRQSRRRIAELTDQLWVNTDDHDREVAATVLADDHLWLEDGVLDPSIEGPWLADPAPGPTLRQNRHRTVRTRPIG